MKYVFLLTVGFLTCLSVSAASRVETSFTLVARDYGLLPGSSNVTLNLLSPSYALADDGRVVFTTILQGVGVGLTNNNAVMTELSGNTTLVARTGDPVPGSNTSNTNTGDVFSGLYGYQPSISKDGSAISFASQTGPEGSQNKISIPARQFFRKLNKSGLQGGLHPFSIPYNTAAAEFFKTFGWNVGNIPKDPAMAAQLSGPGIGPTNDMAVIAGAFTNLEIVAQEGLPAPGTTAEFVSFPGYQEGSQGFDGLALAPDGNVAFTATTTESASFSGVWFGKPGNVQAVAVPNAPAPDSLLGSNYTFGALGVNAVDVNARHELAFATTLAGPGLNDTNSDVVLAGAPGALRIVAQSGQPAPGITNAFFSNEYLGGVFQDVIIGSDGAVVFDATYDTNWDDGLWLTPANGGTPILLMRTGGQAPGTSAGVVFTKNLPYSPTVFNVFMNSRGQLLFSGLVSGPGIGYTNDVGIWLAEPDGSVSLVVRTGDTMDLGGGQTQKLNYLSLGSESPTVAGPEDGLPQPFNDLGAFVFDDNSSGIYLARTGLALSAALVGKDIRLEFPTLAGKHYRVDDKTSLSAPSWSVLDSSVAGTGGEVTVTNAPTSSAAFYRVVRTD